MKVSLSNQKYFKARNGYGMNASLFVDGIKTADVRDKGDGSAMMFDVLNQEKFAALENEVSKCPPTLIPSLGFELELDMGLFVAVLDDAQLNKKKLTLNSITN